jgi:hypothetical protein
MPNWCENKIIITGSKSNIDNMKTQLDKMDGGGYEVGFFQHYYPTPAELMLQESPNRDDKKTEELIAKYGASDWYQWRVANWSTKWDIGHINSIETIETDEQSVLVFNCDTAWAPPDNALRKLSEMFRDTYFYCQFVEQGMGFQGYSSFMNGVGVGEQMTDYFTTADDILCDVEYHYERAIEDTKERESK